MNQYISQEAFYSSNKIGLVNCLLPSLFQSLICTFPNNECQVIFRSIKYPGGQCNWRVNKLFIPKGKEQIETQSNGKDGIRDLGGSSTALVAY